MTSGLGRWLVCNFPAKSLAMPPASVSKTEAFSHFKHFQFVFSSS